MPASRETTALDNRVAAVRRFSRFYTRRIGVLQDTLLGSELSPAEGRIVYELAQHPDTTATALGSELGVDAGYLSRLLQKLEQRGLVERRRSAADRRQSLISLTKQGRAAFATIDERSREQVAAILQALPASDQNRIVRSMEAVEALLGAPTESRVPYILRTHQPGDMGWIVYRHGLLYAQEYGWDENFEALVAEIVANFIRSFDPKRERCWIAERDGEIVGSVMLVADSAVTGKLRLLYVEPSARQLGIGGRLVDECVRFARLAGYETLTLWTNDVLTSARRIYERVGFRLQREEPHHSFGHDLVGQNWALDLREMGEE